MDHRDAWNTRHMLRRRELASHCTLERQVRCARHLQHIAELHSRTQLYMLASMWLRELEKEYGKIQDVLQ